jgi:predicted amidohydrolase
MLREASAAGARLAHFPEGFLSGYAVEDVASWDGVDWALVRSELEDVAALAGELGIWVVLGSAHPFATKARAHAAIHNYWLSLSVPAQAAHLFHSGLIGPHGEVLADAGGEPGLVVATLDRADPALRLALDVARPWRATARSGDIYAERRVTDERSRVRTEF